MTHLQLLRTSSVVSTMLFAGAVFAFPPRNTSHGAVASAQIGGSYSGWAGDNDGGSGHYSASAGALSSRQSASGAASGRARLGTGTLGAYGASERTAGYMDVIAAGHAEFWDTVTFSASSNYDGFIPLQFQIDGEVIGQGKVSYSMHIYDLDYDLMEYEKWGVTSGDITIDTSLDDVLLSPTRSRSFMILMYLKADGGMKPFGGLGNSSMADYMNTMHFKWQLPSEVSFISASGVFNPASIQPVPEPATFAALGLGALGMWRRRKSRNV